VKIQRRDRRIGLADDVVRQIAVDRLDVAQALDQGLFGIEEARPIGEKRGILRIEGIGIKGKRLASGVSPA